MRYRGLFSVPVLSAIAGIVMAANIGCSSSPAPKKAEAPAVPVTGLHALYQMYGSSKQWAPDTQVLALNSLHAGDVKDQPGKSGVWQVTFISQSLGQSRLYTFSATEVSMSMHQGIDGAKAESWSPGRGSETPFPIAAAKIDSDQAYEAALKHPAAAAYAAKNPAMPITYQLAENKGYNNAVWRVIWGESVGTSSFSILVDATTGTYVETLH